MKTETDYLRYTWDSLYLKYLIYFTPLRDSVRSVTERISLSKVKTILSSDYFDASYYKTISGVELDDMSLAVHYLYVGWRLGLAPSEKFSGNAYLACYPDVEKANQCPLLHYEMHGKSEGRSFLTQSDYMQCHITEEEMRFVCERRSQGKKTVLLVSHEFSLTGAPRALLNLAVAMRKLDVEPVIWTLLPGELQKEVEQQNIQSKLVTLLFSGNKQFSKYVEDYIAAFDMVLLNTIVALPKVEYFKNVNIQKMCWIHDGAYGFSCCPFTPKFSYYYTLFDHIFVVGDYAKGVAMSHASAGTNMENFIYGIDDVERKKVIPSDTQHVTMVLAGTIEERKGQDVLLDCLSMLPPDVLNKLRINVVGRAIDKELYRRLEKDNSGCINLKGTMNHEEVLSLMEQMDILLCPSIDDPMPIVCTEAMMLSKPVIVSDHTGTASFIHEGQNGYVAKAGSPQSLAVAITRAVNDKNILCQMGKNARMIFEENFTNEIFKKNIQTKILPLLSSQ